MPKLFLWLCLCGNKMKLESKQTKVNLDEENEVLKEELWRSLKGVKNMYQSNEIMLNVNTLERIQLLLSRENILKTIGIWKDDEITDKQKERFERERSRMAKKEEFLKLANSKGGIKKALIDQHK